MSTVNLLLLVVSALAAFASLYVNHLHDHDAPPRGSRRSIPVPPNSHLHF